MAGKEIARMDLNGSALTRVLTAAVSGDGEELGEYLAAYAGEEDFGMDDFGEEDFGEEDFGSEDFGAEDLATVLNAALAGELEDFGADEAAALQHLMAAAAGDEELSGDDEEAMAGLVRRAATAFPAARRVVQNRKAVAKKGVAAARKVMPMPKKPISKPAPRAPVVARPAPTGGTMSVTPAMNRVLDRTNPGEGPHTPLPLTSSSGQVVAANNTAVITLRPPKDYIIMGLHLQGENAERLVVDSITVEGDPLYAATGSVPGGSFSPLSQRSNLPRKLCKGGRDISITLRNISSADLTAYGTLWGDEGDVSERAARGK